MVNSYYLGGKRKHPKRGSRLKRSLLTLLLSLIALSLWTHTALLPQVRALCETEISNRLEAIANRRAYEILEAGGYSYSDFIRLTYDAEGGVRSASVDTVRLNLLKTSLALSVLESLVTEDISVGIPVGNLLGLLFFSGMGKEIFVTAKVANGMHARFHTEFRTEGINQTRHAIGFSLDFSATYLLTTGKEALSFSVSIPVGETLIVGKVPDTLTQINRLSEEISELEIDDAVDFGHVVP